MSEPVEYLRRDEGRQPEEGIGIALSGGGYRAMLFHLGSLLRLLECGVLARAERVSSVSGGSITAAKLALEFPRASSREGYLRHVGEPIRELASRTIDASSIAGGLLLPGSVADRIADHYDSVLFKGATLQDLPDSPRSVFNATNLGTGSLWRFMKPYMRDYKVGEVMNPRIRLAEAVAASSAFPPLLSPFKLELDPDDFSTIEPGLDRRFLHDISLTDGGVYDNLGLETVYKRYRTLLVSDAGGTLDLDPAPPSDWARHVRRVLDIMGGQVSSVRSRQLIEAFRDRRRHGAYWSIRTDVARYRLADSLPAPFDRTTELAMTPTRLKRLAPAVQDRLVNWGYVSCDAAIRSMWTQVSDAPPPELPYPRNPI